MASMAIYLRSRPTTFPRASALSFSSSSRSHLSSSSSPPPEISDVNPQNTQTNSTSIFKEIRYPRDSQPPRKATSPFYQKKQKQKEFPSPLYNKQQQKEFPISLHQLYKKNLSSPENSGSTDTASSPSYSYDELGEKLRKLRPEGVKKEGENWFSLSELNERLIKLREMEKKEEVKGGAFFSELRKVHNTAKTNAALRKLVE